MLPIFIANSFYIFALGLVIPSLPFMVLARGGDPIFASVIFASFSAAAFISAPIWGIMADKYGAKQTLTISAFLSALCYLLLALSQNVTELFVIRIMAGFSAGWLASSLTYMSNISSNHNRTKAMGVLGASFGIGFTLGPSVSGILLNYYHYEITAFISAMMSLIIACASIYALPASRKIITKENYSLTKSLRIIQKLPNIRLLFLCYFLVLTIFTALEGSFALWIKFILERDASFLSWLLACSGLISIIIQGGLLGRLNKIFSEKTLILCGILLLSCGFLILPFSSSNQVMAFMPVIFAAAGLSFHNPCMQSLMSQSVNENQHGLILGTAQSFSSLARIIGSSGAGLLFITLGVKYFYFSCAFLLILIFCLLLSRLKNHQKHDDNQ